MSTKKSSPAKKTQAKKTQRWSLGLFKSAANGGAPIVLYCRVDGTVAPYYASKVKTKKALFNASYSGVKYSQARKQLLVDAAKAGVKIKQLLAEASAS